MRFIILIFSIIITSALVGGMFTFFHKANVIGEINVLKGRASIKVGEKFETFSTRRIKEDDVVIVHNKGLAELKLNDGSRIRIASGSEVNFKKFTYKENKIENGEIKINSGEVWSDLERLAPSGNFQVETPTIVAAVRGTEFGVSYLAKLSRVWVNEHSVAVKKVLGENLKTISEGKQITVRDDFADDDLKDEPKAIQNPEFDYLEQRFDLDLGYVLPESPQAGPFLPVKPPRQIVDEQPQDTQVLPVEREPIIAGIVSEKPRTDIDQAVSIPKPAPVPENKIPNPPPATPSNPDNQNDSKPEKVQDNKKNTKNNKNYSWGFWNSLRDKWDKYSRSKHWWSGHDKRD